MHDEEEDKPKKTKPSLFGSFLMASAGRRVFEHDKPECWDGTKPYARYPESYGREWEFWAIAIAIGAAIALAIALGAYGAFRFVRWLYLIF